MGFGVLCEVEGEVVKCGEQVGTGGGGGFGIPVVSGGMVLGGKKRGYGVVLFCVLTEG